MTSYPTYNDILASSRFIYQLTVASSMEREEQGIFAAERLLKKRFRKVTWTINHKFHFLYCRLTFNCCVLGKS